MFWLVLWLALTSCFYTHIETTPNQRASTSPSKFIFKTVRRTIVTETPSATELTPTAPEVKNDAINIDSNKEEKQLNVSGT